MTKREWRERQRQDEALARLGIGERDAGRLRKIEATLHRLCEEDCNRGLSPREERMIETRVETARLIVAQAWADTANAVNHDELASACETGRGPAVYFQSDPRGCALYVVPPSVLERFPGHEIDSIYSSGIAVYS